VKSSEQLRKVVGNSSKQLGRVVGNPFEQLGRVEGSFAKNLLGLPF
jgi:hypothetical protein